MADVSKMSMVIVRQAIEIADLREEISSLEFWREFSLEKINSLEKELREIREKAELAIGIATEEEENGEDTLATD